MRPSKSIIGSLAARLKRESKTSGVHDSCTTCCIKYIYRKIIETFIQIHC
ncbi:MAG TPA: hypothetical protein PK772_03985 [Chitinophagaceae bacterium]|nr:hypothetical protein [Chitinophagaceae bacterium]